MNKILERHAPSRVLVHLKTATGISIRSLNSSKTMLQGLSLERSISLRAVPSKKESSLVSTHVFTINDGSSVQEKLDHLRSFPGKLNSP